MSNTIELIEVGACPVCGGVETHFETTKVLVEPHDRITKHIVTCSKCGFYIGKQNTNIGELVKIWNHLSVDQDYYEEERSKQE